MNLRRVGIAWLKREDWPRWAELDPAFEPSYERWSKRMKTAIESAQQAGVPIVKITIDIDEFVAWADAHGKDYGTGARAEYVAKKTMESDRGTH